MGRAPSSTTPAITIRPPRKPPKATRATAPNAIAMPDPLRVRWRRLSCARNACTEALGRRRTGRIATTIKPASSKPPAPKAIR